jgi:hypothetical protein
LIQAVYQTDPGGSSFSIEIDSSCRRCPVESPHESFQTNQQTAFEAVSVSPVNQLQIRHTPAARADGVSALRTKREGGKRTTKAKQNVTEITAIRDFEICDNDKFDEVPTVQAFYFVGEGLNLEKHPDRKWPLRNCLVDGSAMASIIPEPIARDMDLEFIRAKHPNRVSGCQGKKNLLDAYACPVVRVCGVNFRAKCWVLPMDDDDSATSWSILLSHAWRHPAKAGDDHESGSLTIRGPDGNRHAILEPRSDYWVTARGLVGEDTCSSAHMPDMAALVIGPRSLHNFCFNPSNGVSSTIARPKSRTDETDLPSRSLSTSTSLFFSMQGFKRSNHRLGFNSSTTSLNCQVAMSFESLANNRVFNCPSK